MADEFSTDWQRHLDELDDHYAPENFFIEQLTRPSNSANIRDQFFAPSLTEETDLPEEGQLTIDIFQDKLNMYVVAPIAGVRPEDIELVLDKDILTIRGTRNVEFTAEQKNYIYQECYWGRFSRSIILPIPVDGSGVTADFKNGVLKVTLPKAEENSAIAIKVNEIE